MRLPFIQLAQKFVTADAPEIAARLRIQTTRTLGMGVVLFAYAIEKTATEETPPDGVLLDPDAGVVLERMMGWTGETGRCMDAFIRAGVVDKLEVGVRVRGMGRYRSAWESAVRRSEKAKLAAEARWAKAEDMPATDLGTASALPEHDSTDAFVMLADAQPHAQALPEHAASNAQPMLGDAKTQTQTQTQEDVVRASPDDIGPDASDFRLEVQRGKKPRKLSDQENIALALLDRRTAVLGADVVPDKAYGPSRLNKMLAEAVQYPRELVEAAYADFLDADRPATLDPPYPLWTFCQDLPEYISRVQRAGGLP